LLRDPEKSSGAYVPVSSAVPPPPEMRQCDSGLNSVAIPKPLRTYPAASQREALMVAVGFSPRSGAQRHRVAERRLITTRPAKAIFTRRSARRPFAHAVRGLKPTSTVMRSLCDPEKSSGAYFPVSSAVPPQPEMRQCYAERETRCRCRANSHLPCSLAARGFDGSRGLPPTERRNGGVCVA
jgi:hypothetical protein